jgi:O-antigen/teichoic acid export membrane protein
MITIIKKLLTKIGVDGAIFYTILARVIQGGGGIVTIFFIASYLTKVEQGYYYTFGSILAIQVFFELGLSGIITQFVSHEFASLKFASAVQLDGPEDSLSRLSSLLHFCVKWFFVLALILFFILIASGYVFFNRFETAGTSVNWILPWVIISIATACSLMVSPILSFLEGLGKVKDVAKIRFIQQICQISILFICLISGFKLYSSPLANIFTLFIAPIYILITNNRSLLLFIWAQLKTWKVNYRNEIFPFQWRIALSWISGYFMYQLFNPVIFATEGPIAAGQMGITLAVLNGILTISLSWINTKVPLFSNLIAKKDYLKLDSIFVKTVKQSSFISFCCLLFLVLAVVLMKKMNISLGHRFLPIVPLILLSFTTLVNQFVSALATYLRCHKKEPFLVFSVVLGILTASSTLVFGKLFGVLGITIGYSIITIFLSLIWALLIFKKKRKLWHKIE